MASVLEHLATSKAMTTKVAAAAERGQKNAAAFKNEVAAVEQFVTQAMSQFPVNEFLRQVGGALNSAEFKKFTEIVGKAWAKSFSYAFLSTAAIFGGILLSVFLAFGANTSQGLHWAIKEYSDNVADVCSVLTVAYMVHEYHIMSFILQLGFKMYRLLSLLAFEDPKKLPRVLSTTGDAEQLVNYALGMPTLPVYAILSMLAVLAPVVAATFYFAGNSQQSYQILLQKYFDEVRCTGVPQRSVYIHLCNALSGC